MVLMVLYNNLFVSNEWYVKMNLDLNKIVSESESIDANKSNNRTQ